MHIIRIFFKKLQTLRTNPWLIHIGKCGGSTLRSAVQTSGKYPRMGIVHVAKPKFYRSKKYFIVARDPIRRCISAFNWRYKLVVEDQAQRNRFPGEYDILKQYQTLSNLAEALYSEEGELNAEVATQFEAIHHLKERISFYLDDFLKICPKKNIKAVLMTESLSEDIERVFDVPQDLHGHEKLNKGKRSGELSELARANLVKYIRKDYDALQQLHSYGLISDNLMATILKDAGLEA